MGSVAPLVGAWIEILLPTNIAPTGDLSLLSWERGLKYELIAIQINKGIPSLLSWERGLKYSESPTFLSPISRSSRGSVD